VTIGRFCWGSFQYSDADNAPAVVNSTGSGPVLGLIARHQQGLITQYLQSAGMVIPSGFMVTPYSACDMWVRNAGAGANGIYQKAYANFMDGSVTFAATGAAASVSMPTSSIAAGPAVAGTASIAGNVMTVATSTGGAIQPGTILTGPPGIAAGSQVVSQLSGTPGGVGTYALNISSQTVGLGALAGTYGILTVGGGGPPVPGGILSGTGVTAGTTVWGQLTPTTWVVSPSQAAASTTISETSNVETKWVAMSVGAAGEIVKISSWILG
jgi:hypothetical protein